MRSPGRVFWPLAIAVLLADCSTKHAIEESLPFDGVPHPVVDDLVRFTLEYNQGAAFSTHFGAYERWLLIGFSLIVIALLARWYSRIAETGWTGVTGMALVAGGALGNALDRIMSARGVVDFIDVGVGATRFFVFNVADAGLSVGTVLLAYALWRSDVTRREPPATAAF